MNNKNKPLEFEEVPRWFFYFTLPIVITIYSLLWILFFVMGNIIVKIFMVLLIIFILLLARKNAIIRVSFRDELIEVKHLFGYKSYYSFSEVKSLNEMRQFYFLYDIIVVKLKPNNFKKKKFSFYCPDSKRKYLDEFLKTKGFRIRPET